MRKLPAIILAVLISITSAYAQNLTPHEQVFQKHITNMASILNLESVPCENDEAGPIALCYLTSITDANHFKDTWENNDTSGSRGFTPWQTTDDTTHLRIYTLNGYLYAIVYSNEGVAFALPIDAVLN